MNSPRFLAKVVGDGKELLLVSKIDEEDSLFVGKLSRAMDWYYSLSKKK